MMASQADGAVLPRIPGGGPRRPETAYQSYDGEPFITHGTSYLRQAQRGTLA
jgi:hypothetical protein